MAQPPIPTPHYKFSALDRVRFEGREYVYVAAFEAGHIMRLRDGSLDETFSHEDMAAICKHPSFEYDRAYYAVGPTFARSTSGVQCLSDLVDDELEKVLWKNTICQLLLQMEKEGLATRSDASMTKALEKIALKLSEMEIAKHRVMRSGSAITVRHIGSPRTVRKWLQKLEAANFQAIALRDNYRNCGDRKTQHFDPAVSKLMQKHALPHATEKRVPKSVCYDALCREISKLNEERVEQGEAPLKTPSKSTFMKEFDKLDAFFIRAGQRGLENAKNHFHLVTGSPEALRPGQRVEMDGWYISLHKILAGSEFWEALAPEERAKIADRW